MHADLTFAVANILSLIRLVISRGCASEDVNRLVDQAVGGIVIANASDDPVLW